jgi:hypothetical protein
VVGVRAALADSTSGTGVSGVKLRIGSPLAGTSSELLLASFKRSKLALA